MGLIMALSSIPPILFLGLFTLLDPDLAEQGFSIPFFIVFKTIWCIWVGCTSVTVGYLSACQDRSFTIIRRRFSEATDPGSGINASFRSEAEASEGSGGYREL